MATSRQPFSKREDLTDECKELLSILPTLQNDGIDFYQYEGFWAISRVVQGVVQCQKHFKALDSDIILATTPKSGTTWLKAMAFALLNRSKFLDQDHHPLLTTNPHDLVPFLEMSLYGDTQLPDLSTFSSPRLFATHAPMGSLPRSVKDSSCKIVYLCRNPKDTFVSMWHHLGKVLPKSLASNELEKVFDMFCEGVRMYGPFWDHVLGYWNESRKNPHKILFMKYEEIQEQSVVQLKRLAKFLEHPFSSEEEAKGAVNEILRLCSFDHLSKLEVNKTGMSLSTGEENCIYFRKGKVGDWAKVLTHEMAERIDRITEQKMCGSGLKF